MCLGGGVVKREGGRPKLGTDTGSGQWGPERGCGIRGHPGGMGVLQDRVDSRPGQGGGKQLSSGSAHGEFPSSGRVWRGACCQTPEMVCTSEAPRWMPSMRFTPRPPCTPDLLGSDSQPPTGSALVLGLADCVRCVMSIDLSPHRARWFLCCLDLQLWVDTIMSDRSKARCRR